METPGGGSGTAAVRAAGAGGRGEGPGARGIQGSQELPESRGVQNTPEQMMALRRHKLSAALATELVTLYGGTTVQHLGGTPAARWALTLVQGFAWTGATKASRNSQVQKYRRFALEEKRGMPPGEVDLVCYLAWLVYEGAVKPSSFAQYLSGVRRFCETEGILPLPPTPSQSPLLTDALRAAKRFDSQHPVQEAWIRAGISAGQTLRVMHLAMGKRTLAGRQRLALWLVAFCFSFRGGTVGALWPIDFEFYSDWQMSVRPEVLKRTGTDCTRNPRRRLYSVPERIAPADNPVLVLRQFVAEAKATIGQSGFLFSATADRAGTVEFISEAIRRLAAEAGVRAPAGMRFSSHSPRRGMLTEFLLQNPRPSSLVVRARMDWASDNSVIYFCRDVMRSVASAWLVPGALQDQGAPPPD